MSQANSKINKILCIQNVFKIFSRELRFSFFRYSSAIVLVLTVKFQFFVSSSRKMLYIQYLNYKIK